MTEPEKEPAKISTSQTEQKPSVNPASSRSSAMMSLQTQVSFSAGPLPPPEILERYNKIIPGAAERFLKMAETQSQHRQELEKKVVHAGSRDSMLGIIAGVIVSVAVLAVAAFAISRGFARSGTAVAALDVVGLAGVFVYGTRVNVKRLGERQKANRPPQG